MFNIKVKAKFQPRNEIIIPVPYLFICQNKAISVVYVLVIIMYDKLH